MSNSNFLTKDKLQDDVLTILKQAQDLADRFHHTNIDTLHLLAALLENAQVLKVIKLVSPDATSPTGLKSAVDAALTKLPTSSEAPYLSSGMLSLIKLAEQEAGDRLVDLFILLHALTREIKGEAVKLLNDFHIGPGAFNPHRLLLEDNPNTKTPALPLVTDLTLKAANKKLGPVIGREDEVRRLIQMLGRKSKYHCLIVGEQGVGKQSVVHALSSRIAAKNVPEHLKKTEVYQLNMEGLISGGKTRGEVEEKLKKAFDSLKNQDAVLYIHSLEALIGSNSLINGSAGVLSSVLPNTIVRVIASTTPEGLRKLSEKDPYLIKNFATLTLEPPTQEEAIQVLRGVAVRYEKHHQVKIGDPAITAAVKLAKRHIQGRQLPQSALELLDEAASRKRMELDGLSPKLERAINRLDSLKAQLMGLEGDTDPMSKRSAEKIKEEIKALTPVVSEGFRKKEMKEERDNTLTDEDVASVVSEWVKIPVGKMLETDTEKFAQMEERLGKRVVGQDEAVRAVSKAIRRSKSGLRDPRKPIGSFLFLGSSGTGKTLLAKALASNLFDDEEAMIRIDCSELGERHSVSRLLGSPQGYQDSESGGQLTEAVKKKPYSVLLFDEIEKANPDIFNILLQVLDDARLSDARGRMVDFCNTIVIMTTNIGSKDILETPVDVLTSVEGLEKLRLLLRKRLTEFLRVEFLNRIDDQVIFAPITKDGLKTIVGLEIGAIEKLLVEKEVKITLTDEVRDYLSAASFEPAMGARPLKRMILKQIQDPLAEQILAGKLNHGSKVSISMEGEGLKFQLT